MGAWGHGTLSDDTALDGVAALGLSTESRRKVKKLQKTEPKVWLEKLKELHKDYSKSFGRDEAGDKAVLGAASTLLDMECNIVGCEDFLMECVKRERTRANAYIEPKERKEALKLFESFLQKKTLTKQEAQRWLELNLGLVSKIMEHLDKGDK